MVSNQGLNKYDIKVANRKMILELLENNPPLSRIQLAKLTSMSPTSMTRIVNDLTSLNLITEVECDYAGIGRKSTMLSINPTAFFILGISINKFYIEYCIMNFQMKSLFYKYVPIFYLTPPTPEILVERCYDEYLLFLTESNFLDKDIKIIGISFPGSVDSDKKMVISCPSFDWKKTSSFCKYFEEKFQKNVSIENDVKSSLTNEYYRYPSHRATSIAFLGLNNGIGCAFMQNGIILKGINNGAGEIAHITLDHPRSSGGCRYSHEDYHYNLCSSYILNTARRSGIYIKSMEELAARYLQKETITVDFFKSISVQLSSILNLIICLYNPEKIILGGSTMHVAPFLLDLALENTDLFYQDVSENITIELTLETGSESLLGGAIVALNQYCDTLIEANFL